jgi:hypothetical protein
MSEDARQLDCPPIVAGHASRAAVKILVDTVFIACNRVWLMGTVPAGLATQKPSQTDWS